MFEQYDGILTLDAFMEILAIKDRKCISIPKALSSGKKTKRTKKKKPFIHKGLSAFWWSQRDRTPDLLDASETLFSHCRFYCPRGH